MVQILQSAPQSPGGLARLTQAGAVVEHGGGHDFRQIGSVERSHHGAAQIGLGQASAGGVNGREALGQRIGGRLEAGVHERVAQKPAAQLAPSADALAHCQCFEVRRIKIKKPQGAGIGTVIQGHHQLFTGAVTGLTSRDRAFDLHHIAFAG
jgi:hypothetical protein